MRQERERNNEKKVNGHIFMTLQEIGFIAVAGEKQKDTLLYLYEYQLYVKTRYTVFSAQY